MLIFTEGLCKDYSETSKAETYFCGRKTRDTTVKVGVKYDKSSHSFTLIM